MGKVSTGGQMEVLMMGPGKKIKLKAQGLTLGLMAANILEAGSTTICMALVNTGGRMVDAMKGSMKMIRNMASEFILGPMGGNMKETGSMANSMGKANIFSRMELSKWESGTRVEGKSGLKILILEMIILSNNSHTN